MQDSLKDMKEYLMKATRIIGPMRLWDGGEFYEIKTPDGWVRVEVRPDQCAACGANG